MLRALIAALLIVVAPAAAGAQGLPFFQILPIDCNDAGCSVTVPVFQLEDGSVTVPSLSFVNDADTGIYLAADGSLGVATAGSVILTLGSAVNLGGDLNMGANGACWDFSGDGTADDFVTSLGENTIYVRPNNTSVMVFTTAGTTLSKRLDVSNQYIESGTKCLAIGGDATDTYSLGTNGTCIHNHLGVNGDFYVGGDVVVTTYTQHHTVTAGSAALGPTAPTLTTKDRARVLCFDADAELANISFEVPTCWDGASDLELEPYWVFEDGDVPQLNETVKWDIRYNSIDWGTEHTDVRAGATATVTYTESANPGDDKATVESTIVIDYDSGTEPIAVGDVILIEFDRDVSGDTYSGDACVEHWEIKFEATSPVCDHY